MSARHPLTMAMSISPGLVGVLGGMGPLATIDFMRKVLQATPACADQDHVPLVVSSIPQVPDRSAAFRGDGASPLAAMVASGQRLADAGVGLIAMPCNTAHLWFDELQQALEVPMLHIVDAAIEDAIDKVGPQAPLGLLCTDGTLASGLYMNRAPWRAQWTLPTAAEMLNWVMPGIDAVKAGDLLRGEALLQQAAQALARRGARALVLGCTEVPVVLDDSNTQVPVVDATASLARRVVKWSTAQRGLPLAEAEAGAVAPALCASAG
ncbi:MAG: amino acid racemase [Pseudomonadota bacterium]